MLTGETIAKDSEGCHKLGKDGLYYPYICPAGYPTIGWGHLVKSMNIPPITGPEADVLFVQDWVKHERQTTFLSPVLLKEEHRIRRSAITCFVYNLGAGNYQTSTLRKMVNREDWDEAKLQLLKWVRGGGKVLPGLVKRRKLEASLL